MRAYDRAKLTIRSMGALWPYGLSTLCPAGRGTVRILTYHRVLPKAEIRGQFVQPGMYVSDVTFKRQIAYLLRAFRVIGLGELLDLWNAGPWDARARYCVITFDDGWVDTFRYALPILRSYGVPATVFLPTERIGTTQWFWPDRLGHILLHCDRMSHGARQAVWSSLAERLGSAGVLRSRRWPEKSDEIIECSKRLAPGALEAMIEEIGHHSGLLMPEDRCLLTWGEVEAMGAAGISFGSHSATHRILTAITPEEVRLELESSLDTLRRRGVNMVPALAYPNGDFNTAVAEIARQAGYVAAFTTRRGDEHSRPVDRFAVSRIGVHEDIASTTPLFASHILRRARRAA